MGQESGEERQMIRFDPVFHVYRDERGRSVPSVSTVIREAGLGSIEFIPHEAFERGSAVHELTAKFDRKTLDERRVDPLYAGYLAAWIGFRRETGFVPKAIEQPGENSILGFAGTPDRIGSFRGGRLSHFKSKRAIVEIKSNSCPSWTGLQLGAYALLQSNPFVYDRCVVVLLENGDFRFNPKDVASIEHIRAFETIMSFRNYCRKYRIS